MIPAVLIHGLFGAFGDERTWSRLRPRPVIVPDLLGYGADVGTPAPVTMQSQVEHLREVLGDQPVHLVGHSVGGVVATLYAHRHPEQVRSLVLVEGNLAPADAFWSAQLAQQSPEQVSALLEGYRADPAAWCGEGATAREVEDAEAMLAFQEAPTLLATASSVVQTTSSPTWEPLVREVFTRLGVDLVAGQTSRAGWHVPDWALAAARSHTEIPDTGHLMMFQRPQAFGDALAGLIDGR